MLTNLGPGVLPQQFALIQKASDKAITPVFFNNKYYTVATLLAMGWDQQDPEFLKRCMGPRPQGAMELSWSTGQQVMSAVPGKLPTIPVSQLRYIPAYDYALIAKNLASIFHAMREPFAQAQVGGASGIGLTSYGPFDLPLEIALSDVNERRELYEAEVTVHPFRVVSQLVAQFPGSALDTQVGFFGNGAVEVSLTYVPLGPMRKTKGRAKSAKPTSFRMFLPLDPLRIVLKSQEAIARAQGRLAALVR